jgi:hypothetical protein
MNAATGKTAPVKIIHFAELIAAGVPGPSCEPRSPELDSTDGPVILDLSGVDSLDPSHLTFLLQWSRGVRTQGGDVSLSSLSKLVRFQAERMSLHRIWDIFNTPEEALRCYAACPSPAE